MAIGVGSLVPRIYGDFRGIDATKRDVNLSRSPDMCNMWINYKDTIGKCIETRPGLESFLELNKKQLNISLKGNTIQNGTPTPSSPIPVNVVSGDNEVVVCGKNIQANEWQVGRYDGSATTTNIHLKITNASLFEENQSYVLQFKSTNSNYKSKSVYLQSTNGEAFFGSIGYDSTNQIYYCTKTMSSTEINLLNGNQVRLAVFVSGGVSSGDITEGMITKGNTIQTTYEPYQSQNYPLYLGVENLFDKSTATYQVGYFSSNGTLNSGGSSTVITSYIPIQPNTQYYLSGNTLENVCYYDENKTFIERITSNPRSINKNAYFIRCQFTTASFNLNTIELTKGSTPQYISDTPIELNKIGTYQDYIYKDNGNWYLHKEIGKVVLNGSETDFSYTNGVYYSNTYMTTNYINTALYSNYFVYGGTGYNTSSAYSNGNNVISLHNSDKKTIYMRNDSLTSLANWQSWLSSHNTSIYFILQTPTETEITDTNLISQLEDLKGATYYDGVTNIIQTNSGAPFEIESSQELIRYPIHGMYYYATNSVQMLIVHAGINLYKVVDGVATQIYTGMTTTHSEGIVYDDLLLIKDGANYLQFDGETCREVIPYVPITRKSIVPTEEPVDQQSGTTDEGVNMLSDYQINGFVGDGVSRYYKLGVESIDNDFVPIVTIGANGTVVDRTTYSVDYARGLITFNTAPEASGTDGHDNVFIKFKKHLTGVADMIKYCQHITAFNNEIFFWGNPDYPNTLFFTEQTNPEVWAAGLGNPGSTKVGFVPTRNYVKDGYDYAKIKAVIPANNALWVFKEPNATTTAFYHMPQYTTDSVNGYEHYDYASVYSSIAAGCVSTGVNFNDDIVFFSERGLEGVTGDVTTEQALSHRSSLIDALMTSEEDYKNVRLAEWEGYLLAFIGNNVYLADSRGKFQNEDHMEYDWFKWELDKPVQASIVIDGVLYLGFEDGSICTLTDNSEDRTINSYWTTPEDEFMVGQYQKTTSKRGCVVNMKGEEVTVHTKIDNKPWELINTYTNTKEYVVCRIKKKKWKSIQLKFSSNKPFGLFSCTLQAYVGGYVKR